MDLRIDLRLYLNEGLHMRIAMDVSAAERQYGGISRYTYELLAALAGVPPKHQFELVSIWRSRRDLLPLPTLPQHMHVRTLPWPRRVVEWTWAHLHWPDTARALPPHDVFLAPHFTYPWGRYAKLVVTIHDLLFLDHPEWFTPSEARFFAARSKAAIRAANHVIAVSNSTKEAIVRHGLAPAEKITVIPEGCSFIAPTKEDRERTRRRLQLPDRYLLFVGAIEPRKNLASLVNAYTQARRRGGLDLPLILAGRRGWLQDELDQAIAASPYRSDIHLLYNFERADHGALLAGAHALLFPSLAEGFGLPVLEGFAAGVPVLTSTVSSLTEVAGDAAFLVDPTNVDAIADGIVAISTDLKLRSQLTERGTKRSQQFTWAQTAQKTLDLLERVVRR